MLLNVIPLRRGEVKNTLLFGRVLCLDERDDNLENPFELLALSVALAPSLSQGQLAVDEFAHTLVEDLNLKGTSRPNVLYRQIVNLARERLV